MTDDLTRILPAPLRPLGALAYDLAWTWWPEARALFAEIDPDAWRRLGANPVALLHEVDGARLVDLAADQDFTARVDELSARISAEREEPPRTAMPSDGLVAYFCAEFGLSQALPIYSGGLGILAGDHVKSASELGLPLVGVGLFYRGGYFVQALNDDGQQEATAHHLDPARHPLTRARCPDGSPATVTVQVEGRDVQAAVWRVTVGRAQVLLLDTDVEGNTPEDRLITGRLYGGDDETRIRQEILLGFGGIRALDAVGLTPTVFHMNEGHAAFLTLERIRRVVAKGADFETARTACARNNIFTTHTPVPAGFDVFTPEQMDRLLPGLPHALGTTRDRMLALGEAPGDGFNMAYLAMRCADRINGVSELHAEVSRGMFQSLWPDTSVDHVPIVGVTNGVHTRTWVSHELGHRLAALSGLRWEGDSGAPDLWGAAERLPSAELWEARQAARADLVKRVRARHAKATARRGGSAEDVARAGEVLDPEALTIGFARRFATYKRATLVLRDRERLDRLLNDPQRPVQMVFAGKAHPRDVPGQAFLRELHAASQDPRFQGRLIVLEGYDIGLGRELVQGVDVWLNTPRRPREASGTSGMKVAANGGLNLSILDGWWAEAFDGQNGWAIGRGENWEDPDAGDVTDAATLLERLERDVIPTFYTRDADGLPQAWLDRMRRSMLTSGPVYTTDRMVRDYTDHLYIPAHEAGRSRGATSCS